MIFELKFAQDAIQYFHSFIPDVAEQLCRQHPSKLICAVLPSVTDQSICKRLITCILAALRANGINSLLKYNKIYKKNPIFIKSRDFVFFSIYN